MADGGYLVPASEDPSKEKIWTETKKRLERFLPDLFKEIFPDAPRQETSAPVSEAPSPAPSNHDNTATDEKADVTDSAPDAASHDGPETRETAAPIEQQTSQ